MTLFPDHFTQRGVDTGEVRINCRIGGDGPPLLLLHGYPETHAMWHRVAPILAETHTLIMADLRGYGGSDKPAPSADAREYTKRVMAADQLSLMQCLGYERFAVLAHDRGARVALRLAFDAPEAVTRLALLDIVPTRHVYANVTEQMASAYYHWFFLPQRSGIPERLLAADPEAWVRSFTDGLAGQPLDPAAVAEYTRWFSDAATIAATCADYRAGIGLDRDEDDVTAAAGQRISCPTLVLWGEHSFVNSYDVPAVWREYVADLTAAHVPAGHFLPEENPDAVLRAVLPFLVAN